MNSRTVLSALAVCVVLTPLAGCGGAGDDPSRARDGSPAAKEPSAPSESRAPSRGKGSKDPDDVNGDGHRDLVLPVAAGSTLDDADEDQRIAVVYGSTDGLDPSTRTVYGRRDLGLPEPPKDRPNAGRDNIVASEVVTADLDGDGFPDFVTAVAGEYVQDGQVNAPRTIPYVVWGGPGGPREESRASPVRLPQSVAKQGVRGPVVRGDFDGDGHHDVAAIAYKQSSLVVMYGPFTRSGEPARIRTGPEGLEGSLAADHIDPSGEPRATSLLLRGESDGEQSDNTLFAARVGTGPATDGRQLRRGSAYAFGDFDGDGQRDVAVGDSGSRNDEPGEDTEASEIDGSLAVYPGGGGEPVTHRLPETPEPADGVDSPYGPGGFTAADPDGDGRDGILVATYEGATLIDGDRRTPVLREGPARSNGRKTPAKDRHARPVDAADFDGDGKDELILNWSADALFGSFGEDPTHWWITDGTTSGDKTSFTTTEFAPRDS